MKTVLRLIIPLLIVAIFAGCSKTKGETNSMYKKITAEEAKSIIDTENDIVILDVRTAEEFSEGHIKNAVLIPDYDIESSAQEKLTDKHKKILVYCRSGRRSKTAAESLVKMGYTSVYDFGGIIDWPYDTEKYN